MLRRTGLGVATALVAMFSFDLSAGAQVVGGSNDVPPVSDAAMGRVAVSRGVQGPAGLFTARLALLVNASKGHFGEPTSLAPDLYYSITDTLQIGLVHTGPWGWQTPAGAGICFTGKGEGGCRDVYNTTGFDLLYGLLYGDFHLSLHSSLFLEPVADPTGAMWAIGVTGKFHFSDLVALLFDPKFGIALSNRDNQDDAFYAPLELQFQLSEPLSLKVLSGVSGALSDFGNTSRVPLGLGLVGNLSESIDLGVRFSFDNLLGSAPKGADYRSLGLLMNIRI